MKFLRHPTTPTVDSMRVIGTSNSLLSIPLHSVVTNEKGITTYETMYSFLDSNNRPVLVAYPGSYGTLIAARSARGGRY